LADSIPAVHIEDDHAGLNGRSPRHGNDLVNEAMVVAAECQQGAGLQDSTTKHDTALIGLRALCRRNPRFVHLRERSRVVQERRFMADQDVRAFAAEPLKVGFSDLLLRPPISSRHGSTTCSHWRRHAFLRVPDRGSPGVLRPLRLLRLVKLLSILQLAAVSTLRGRIVLYAAGSSVLFVTVAALAIFDVERNAPGATITSFGDALWCAVVTITTVGYGDMSPVTLPGRFIAVGMMVAGIALLGTVAELDTKILATPDAAWINKPAATIQTELAAQTHAGLIQLDKLRTGLRRPGKKPRSTESPAPANGYHARATGPSGAERPASRVGPSHS